MLRRALTIVALLLAPALAHAQQPKLVAPKQIEAPTVTYPEGAKGDADGAQVDMGNIISISLYTCGFRGSVAGLARFRSGW